MTSLKQYLYGGPKLSNTGRTLFVAAVPLYLRPLTEGSLDAPEKMPAGSLVSDPHHSGDALWPVALQRVAMRG
jgi:hypothetical protein